MPKVIVISSYVAASRVGGGIAPYVLAPLRIESALIPTCLFGRHPGRGDPGGSRVEPDTMWKMLRGVEAEGLFSTANAVLTGHFSSPEQVAVAAEAIDRIRAAPRETPLHGSAGPLIVVDPVMGDEDRGLYVREETAAAIMQSLVPRADLVTPNLWEFARLQGGSVSDFADPRAIARTARAAGGSWLVSSARTWVGLGVVYVGPDGVLLAETPRLPGDVPNGTGDLLTLRFLGGLLSGSAPDAALGEALGVTFAAAHLALEWGTPDLPLAACQDRIRSPTLAPVRALDI